MYLPSNLDQALASERRPAPATSHSLNPPDHLRHQPWVGVHTTDEQQGLLLNVNMQWRLGTQNIEHRIADVATHIEQTTQTTPIKGTQPIGGILAHAPPTVKD